MCQPSDSWPAGDVSDQLRLSFISDPGLATEPVFTEVPPIKKMVGGGGRGAIEGSCHC